MLDFIWFRNEKTDSHLDNWTQVYSITIVSYAAPLTARPQQHMSTLDENLLLKSRIKLRHHKFSARVPQTTWRSASKNEDAQLHIDLSYLQIPSF